MCSGVSGAGGAGGVQQAATKKSAALDKAPASGGGDQGAQIPPELAAFIEMLAAKKT